jgi:hypothetical protein
MARSVQSRFIVAASCCCAADRGAGWAPLLRPNRYWSSGSGHRVAVMRPRSASSSVWGVTGIANCGIVAVPAGLSVVVDMRTSLLRKMAEAVRCIRLPCWSLDERRPDRDRNGRSFAPAVHVTRVRRAAGWFLLSSRRVAVSLAMWTNLGRQFVHPDHHRARRLAAVSGSRWVVILHAADITGLGLQAAVTSAARREATGANPD